MDKITKYQQAILKILNKYAKVEYANVDGENRVFIDKENHRYQVVTIGWSGNKFIHDSPMHFDIINGKVWIQKNNTEWDVGKMLEEDGISKKEIVLGFLKPSTREYSEYAVA